MYVNQIDNIIDKILDELYLEGLSKDGTFRSIISGNKINYVEYRNKINKFIQKFMETIDVSPIQRLINNKENLQKILNIIKRYVAYYYFLSIAYYYTGTIKEFRNNLIQYSKLQENSEFVIKNFFDTENNHQIIIFFKMIKDVSNIITMTELQRKTLNLLEVKDAINFLNNLGKDFVDNYLLMVVRINDEERVEINVHNLIKTIVFREIYRNQEQSMVFEILNDIEENEQEYTYIDIVVTREDVLDFDSFHQMFMGEENNEILARDLFELVNETNRIVPSLTIENKNNGLLKFNMITPIVDDFLRYHRDTEKLGLEGDKTYNMPLVSTNNAKNVQLALLYQQRKKKENTKAQLIVNRIDAITDFYSENVKNNPDVLKDIKKNFQNPFSYRKAVMHNYLEEVRVVNKIFNQGRKAIENNEYYMELLQIINHAYFNFKDFQNYGTSITINMETPINMLRYSNIEYQNQHSNLEVDMHTAINGDMINLLGLALGPFINGPIQCERKMDMVDIRNISISYYKNGEIVKKNTQNGYKAFRKIMKHFFINTITVSKGSNFYLYNDYNEIQKINPEIFNKIIYWIYDPSKDEYEMNTYEDLKNLSFQEIIKFMNSLIYDDIIKYLTKKLSSLINENSDLSSFQIQSLLEWFSNINHLVLNQEEKREIFINEYLKNMELKQSQIVPIKAMEYIEKPEFRTVEKISVFTIPINMTNPLHPTDYQKLEIYKKEEKETSIITKVDSKCKHENEWNELIKMKSQNVNAYNMAVTQFIGKFAIETLQLEFVCRICGQLLPLKQYVQDGNYDNNTQKFVTAYVPLDVPLEDIREYSKYKLTIRYLDGLINRISLITGTNMLVGPNLAIKQRRKSIIKSIIDLIIKHNTINLHKNQNNEERLEYYSKKFNIDKDLDNIYFFELNDNIIQFDPNAPDIKLTRLKYNNILLYFTLIFITELNGTQITMMYFDKIANIYVFLKYGVKLFDNLLIKKNVSDMETAPITEYPVLCYLIYLIGYFLFKYKIWYHPTANTKVFNPYYLKIIINSIVDLFNSISIDAGKMPNDYVYLLTSSKLYSQLNTTFKNNYIINALKKIHIKYLEKPTTDNVAIIPTEELVKTYPIKNPIEVILPTRKLPSFKLSNGINYDIPAHIIYPYTKTITDITNCPYGSYHYWANNGKDVQCLFCNEKGEDVNGKIDRTLDAYYYDLNKIASRYCLEGTLHNFENGVCVICGRKSNEIFTINDIAKIGETRNDPNLKDTEKKIIVDIYIDKFKRQIEQMYSRQDLDKLEENLDRIEDQNIQHILKLLGEQQEDEEHLETLWKTAMNELIVGYRKETGDKMYGQTATIVDKLIDVLESLIGTNTDLDINKYPVYLRDNVYIIGYNYDGTPLNEVIILTEKDGRINFRENHPFFKTDVYYYTDNRTQVDVFYQAISLRLLGYKEKHKEYVLVNSPNAYLIINYSLKNRILTIGYQTKYINIGDIFDKNSKIIPDITENYFDILDCLIRDHIYKTKTVVDRIISILYKIKNYQSVPVEEAEPITLETTINIDILVSKYAQLLKDITFITERDTFNGWNELRNMFTYEPINWLDTNIRPTGNMYINSDIINYYDISSNLMICYLVNELIVIINSNPEKIDKTNIAQMYIGIINYVYNLYNIDPYKNSHDLKRFEYILYGSDFMVDILRRGQGLQQSKAVEENLEEGEDITAVEGVPEEEQEEIEDLKEEAEALDIEGDYFAEEDEDYAPEGEIEV